jgi:hypothetical protein
LLEPPEDLLAVLKISVSDELGDVTMMTVGILVLSRMPGAGVVVPALLAPAVGVPGLPPWTTEGKMVVGSVLPELEVSATVPPLLRLPG